MRLPKLLSPGKVDVLIVDDASREWIEYCIPASKTFSTLPLRNVVPWIMTPQFLLKGVSRFLQKQGFGMSILCAIIDILEPKVLITYTDNGGLMGKLKSVYPEKLVISVQNGTRCQHPITGWVVGSKISVLYGFGDYEKALLDRRGVSVDEYIPAGSLKHGIYRSLHGQKKGKKKRDICFISAYRPNFSDNPVSAIRLFGKYHKSFFSALVKVCEDNELTLTVAFKTNELSEFEYYKSLDVNGSAKFIANDKKELSSYIAAEDSRVMVALLSSLAFELFGSGEKVLFGSSAQKDLIDEFGLSMNFEKMPEMVLLDSFDSDSVYTKLIALLEMDVDKYLDSTENARSYYMKTQEVYVHEQIQDRILEHC